MLLNFHMQKWKIMMMKNNINIEEKLINIEIE